MEEVLTDAFDRAVDYQKAMKANPNTRRDLELEAISNIMNNKLFITCHSYVQPEITYTMRVIEKFKAQGYNFKVNTFTHILELSLTQHYWWSNSINEITLGCNR